MKSIKEYSENVFSQNGEDGILAEAIKRINPKLKVAVEFGGADGYFCSNTARLRDVHGWKVYMYDYIVPDFALLSGLVEWRRITPENVNHLPKCSILSIDIDGNDYAIWSAYCGEPDIVVIEINSSLSPDYFHFSPDSGASFAAMNDLAISKGYFLLCHTGNCIYVKFKHQQLFPDRDESFNTQWL